MFTLVNRFIQNLVFPSQKASRQTNRKNESRAAPHTGDDGLPAELDPAAVDSAPDIITAHDTDSIYETLDGRRAARAKPQHVTAGDTQPRPPTDKSCAEHCERPESNYDQLGQFHRRGHAQTGPSGNDRFLPRQLYSRPVTQIATPARERCGRDRDTASWRPLQPGAVSPGQHGAPLTVGDTLQASLARLTRQNLASGKQVVCQLTVVGVMENGNPSSLEPPDSPTAACFLLQPHHANSKEEGAEISARPAASRATFRVRNTAAEEDDSASGGAPASREYFILERVDSQDDLSDIPAPIPLRHKACSGHGHGAGVGRRATAVCCGHVPCPIAPTHYSSEGPAADCRRAFRNTRINSLPAGSLCSTSPLLPPRNPGWPYSQSSPQSPFIARREEPAARKLDSEALKVRIRQEMRALGFLGDAEPSEDYEDARVALGSQITLAGSDVFCPSPRPPGNEYYILEPDADSVAGVWEVRDDPVTPRRLSSSSVQWPVLPGGWDRSEMWTPQRQAPSGPPPRLPRRNATAPTHSRSRSETPVYQASRCAGAGGQEEGPVVVSLKKARSGDANNVLHSDEILRRGAPPPQSFRPRIQSEPGAS